MSSSTVVIAAAFSFSSSSSSNKVVVVVVVTGVDAAVSTNGGGGGALGKIWSNAARERWVAVLLRTFFAGGDGELDAGWIDDGWVLDDDVGEWIFFSGWSTVLVRRRRLL